MADSWFEKGRNPELLSDIDAGGRHAQKVITASGSQSEIHPIHAAVTERGGAIAVGGTSQTLMSSNLSRSYILIYNPKTAAGQNIATAETLYFRFSGAAAGVDNGTAFELEPGEYYEMQGSFVTINTIVVNAATTAHRYIAAEG